MDLDAAFEIEDALASLGGGTRRLKRRGDDPDRAQQRRQNASQKLTFTG